MADGNALVKAQVQTGGAVGAFVPQSFDEAWRIAGALAGSGITPFKRQEEVMAVMMAGAEVGLTPFASTQSFAVINGRVAIWGDGMLGVVLARGVKVEEWTVGEIAKGDFEAFCKVTRPTTGEVTQRSFSLIDAKRAGLVGKQGPWTQYPQRMAPMRARSWALRDGCADILRGIKMAEEMQDVPPEDVRVIDHTGDNDQRPAEERQPERRFIEGKEARDLCDDLMERMSACRDLDALEQVQSEAERAAVSKNRAFALAEYYEACAEAISAGREPPAPPLFAEAPEPSPFAALSAQALAVSDAASLAALNAALKAGLGRCNAEERAKLQVMHAAAKQRAAPAEPGRGAGKDEDAGKAGNGGADGKGEAPPASSSPFEALKQGGLAILQLQGPRRRTAALAKWREQIAAANSSLTEAERAEIARIDENVAIEVAG